MGILLAVRSLLEKLLFNFFGNSVYKLNILPSYLFRLLPQILRVGGYFLTKVLFQ